VAPVEVREVVPEELELDVGLGLEGGVPGGVEGGMAGGVPGGVVGGVLGAEPTRAPVRIGGHIKAPRLLHRVDPVYPMLARQARIAGRIELEATVDERGYVRDLRVVRGIPLLDQAALEAVRQWRYQPLLLNGEPQPFVLRVGVNFGLVSANP
jgi:protein TonB